MWPIGSSRWGQNSNSNYITTVTLGRTKEKKEKDNQYKLKKVMAIASGLTSRNSAMLNNYSGNGIIV